MTRDKSAGKAARAAAIILALAGIGVFTYYAKELFCQYPPVWPDEALYADPAINLIRRGTMGMSVLAGSLAGIGEHTYLSLPLYYLYLAGVFGIFGVSLIVLKLSSLAAAVAVMLLTYWLGVRSGLGRWFSLVPVSMLTVDAVFLRGALIGRMDMLTLALILLSLVLATDLGNAADAPKYRRAFLTGVVCALATLTHPLGAASAIGLLGAIVLRSPRTARRRMLLAAAGGLILPFLAWGVYILQDPRSFIAQFGTNIMKKQVGVFTGVVVSMGQYGLPLGIVAALAWLIGLAGLWLAARRSGELLALPLCQLPLLLATAAGEMWYPLYLCPLTAIGVCYFLLRLGERKISEQSAVAVLALAVVVSLAAGNLRRLHALSLSRFPAQTTALASYTAWCRAISAQLPPSSTVTLTIIPDPYFGLVDRRDLVLREFVHERLPFDRGEYLRHLSESDYIIVRNDEQGLVGRFAESHGDLIATIQAPIPGHHFARIFQIRKAGTAAPEPRFIAPRVMDPGVQSIGTAKGVR